MSTNLSALETEIWVTGPDAKNFLQGQLTCHMDHLTPQGPQLGAHCNLKGRVVALYEIEAIPAGFKLTLPSDLAPTGLKKLEHYARFSKVSFELKPSPISSNELHQKRWTQIQTLSPWVDSQNTELFLAHELNLKTRGALSFNKGCYLGQEIITRLEHLGKLKKTLIQKTFPAGSLAPIPGTRLNDQEQLVCILPDEAGYQGLVLKHASTSEA